MAEIKKSNINITIKDVIWNYAGSILNLGMNLILLPIILKVLTSNELGMWYVFSSIAGLLVLIDFGFSPSISRSVTCAWCGAKKLKKEGLDTTNVNLAPNYSLLKSLTIACQRIYLIMASIAGIILFTVGTYYIINLTLNSGSNYSYYLFAWIIYGVSIVINLYFSYWSSFLKGIGAIKESNIATILSRSIFIVMSALGLLLGGGLIAISLSMLISGIVLRILSKKSFKKIVGKEYLMASSDSENYPKAIFHQLLPSSSKYGIVAIGGFLSTRAITLLCSSFLGLEITASYGLTIQLFDFAGSLSQLLFQSYAPMITSAKISNDKERVTTLFAITIAFQSVVGFFGIIGICFFGTIFLNFIGSNASLLSTNMLFALGVVLFFEWNSSVFVNFIMTSNRIPFAKASIISGALIALISYILLKYTAFGVWSLIVGRGIVGFLFNNWYWPMYVCKELNLSTKDLLHTGYRSLSIKLTELIVKGRK